MKKLMIVFFSSLSVLGWARTSYQVQWFTRNIENKIVFENLVMTHDVSTGFTYAVGSDSANLYVKLVIKDKILQQKILHTGLTVWLDTKGKKRQYQGFEFPLGKQPDHKGSEIRNSVSGNLQLESKYTSGLAEVNLIGLDAELKERLVMAKNPLGMDFKLMVSEKNELVYVAVIPWKMICQQPESYFNGVGKLSIGFKTGKVDFEAMRQHAGGGRPAGSSGRPMAGMPATKHSNDFMGMSRSGAGNRELMQEMMSSTELWLKKVSFVWK